MEQAALPTTSYAVLGMLALRSWTGYELTQQMRRSLDYCWPKAESVLYDEPRRLVQRGLARTTQEEHGGRTRTRYTITAAGRRALRTWLATDPSPPRLELEPMLRLLYADQGEVDDLRRSMEAFRRWATERYEGGMAMFADYLETGGPFPDRLHVNVLFGAFFAELFELIDRWTRLVETEAGSWPGTAGVGMTDGARAVAEGALARYRDG